MTAALSGDLAIGGFITEYDGVQKRTLVVPESRQRSTTKKNFALVRRRLVREGVGCEYGK
jgi:hypothetical protein